MTPRVVLIGPPGAGKSTIARVLADRLGIAARDTDEDVEREAGRAVADIFVEEGEDAFRAYERAAVARAVDEHDGVLAVGGGAVLDAGNRRHLAGGPVVFLDVSVKYAASRVGFNRDRPLLLGNPRAQWIRLMEQRRPLYEEIATHRVNTDDRTPDDVAAEIAQMVGAG